MVEVVTDEAPEANYNGADSFTYKANDGELDSERECGAMRSSILPQAIMPIA